MCVPLPARWCKIGLLFTFLLLVPLFLLVVPLLLVVVLLVVGGGRGA